MPEERRRTWYLQLQQQPHPPQTRNNPSLTLLIPSTPRINRSSSGHELQALHKKINQARVGLSRNGAEGLSKDGSEFRLTYRITHQLVVESDAINQDSPLSAAAATATQEAIHLSATTKVAFALLTSAPKTSNASTASSTEPSVPLRTDLIACSASLADWLVLVLEEVEAEERRQEL